MLTFTIFQAVLIAMALIIAGAILGALLLSEFIKMGELGCDDPSEEHHCWHCGHPAHHGSCVNVHPDVERSAWRNASVKTHHAD